MKALKQITKLQRETLQVCVSTADQQGKNCKPIHFCGRRLSKEDNFSKSYTRYTEQMAELHDAGIIEPYDGSSGANNWKVKDIEATRNLLQAI